MKPLALKISIPLPRYGTYYNINDDSLRKGWQRLFIGWGIEHRCFCLRVGLARWFVKADVQANSKAG